MESYTLSQWLLFFFVYCFFGWVWESCFVSVRKKQWINRGFLYGPVIPIYGFGAILILLFTLRVRDSLPLIYLLGMLGATALEYGTGDVMERLFHVRYWDYSDKPLNLNGHICLRVSLGWGVFSVLLVRVIHPPVEALLLQVPASWAEVFDLLFIAAFSVDLTLSVRSALDLKELLEQLSASNETLAHIGARLEETASFLAQSTQDARRKLGEVQEQLRDAAEQRGAALARKKEAGLTALETRLAARREKKSRFMEFLERRTAQALNDAQTRLPQAETAEEREKLEHLVEELSGFDSLLARERQESAARRDRDYRRALSLLGRNPSAVSPRHGKEIEEVRSLDASREQKD